MTTKHILVKGRVQGVGFRAHTQKEALKRDLHGWVRNLTDGRVEILVRGELLDIDALVDWIRQGGPPAGDVSELLIEDGVESLGESGFTIRESGTLDE